MRRLNIFFFALFISTSFIQAKVSFLTKMTRRFPQELGPSDAITATDIADREERDVNRASDLFTIGKMTEARKKGNTSVLRGVSEKSLEKLYLASRSTHFNLSREDKKLLFNWRGKVNNADNVRTIFKKYALGTHPFPLEGLSKEKELRKIQRWQKDFERHYNDDYSPILEELTYLLEDAKTQVVFL